MRTFDVAVVGRGLFGSAAARHLADAGCSVAAIGPTTDDGPTGMPSSHDDEARLTRRVDADERWAPFTERAVDAYRTIEQRSGIDFYRPVGGLTAARPGGDGKNGDPIPFLVEHSPHGDVWEPGNRGWKARWPMLEFPATHAIHHDPAPAGFIRPKRMIAAQEALTAEADGHLVDDTVASVTPATGGGYRIETTTGAMFEAERVVIATGAFANVHGLLPKPAAITVKTEIVVLGEVSDADAERLADYPTVLHQIDPGRIDDIYMTPPLRFPDGRHWVKLGANTELDTWPTSLEEMRSWFASDTDPDHLPILQPALRALWPEIEFVSFRTKPCIVTYTPDHIPLIEEVAPGLVVATAGNGSGAKGADAWGAAAAELVLGGSPI
ncbi:MAG: FAD-dependent oxidoreductase [Actinomycetota bacterium]